MQNKQLGHQVILIFHSGQAQMRYKGERCCKGRDETGITRSEYQAILISTWKAKWLIINPLEKQFPLSDNLWLALATVAFHVHVSEGVNKEADCWVTCLLQGNLEFESNIDRALLALSCLVIL